MIARIAAAAILLAVPGTAALADSPTASAAQRGVDGRNVTRVFHSGGGSFEVTEDGRWFEFGDDGAIIHQFEERGRDRSRVDLYDSSRGTRVWIDLDRREISGKSAFGSPQMLYQIVDADAGNRGRGWRGRRGQGGGGWDRGDNGPGRGNGGWDRGAREIEVGPIWNQRDAETKCRNKARELRGEWNGQWRTTVQGRMSVCSIDTGGRGGNGNGNGGWNGGGNNGGGWGNNGGTRDIEVGPIWNQRDAETKCRNKAREMRGEWNGQWRTTVQGRMSVCEIRFR